MKSAFRQPLLFAIVFLVTTAALAGMALLAELTLAARTDLPVTDWMPVVQGMILPGVLAALVIAQLPAGLSRRGGPLLLATVALAVCWGGRQLIEGPMDQRQAPAPVALVAGRFVPLASRGQYVYAEEVDQTRAAGVVIVDTGADRGWRMRHIAEAEIRNDEGTPTIAGLPLRDPAVYRGLVSTSTEVIPALTGLERDLGILLADIKNASEPREEILLLLAPISVLAGLGFLVRISRWPLVGGAVALACSRVALVVYAGAGDQIFRDLAGILGSWSHLISALTLLTLGALLILADLLTPDHRYGEV